ncbi:DUF3102 domain-containing protein [Clostridium sp. D33t1_170424_F3]|uniref:DUF3102 domain-containing protein n=1 Tax=Clostridium sp. D33t1_170424_F3 TaxID=2787099 RepID=UPI0018AC6A1D|nr:DUF3102 domain-containing protein [Clostridium sp. D33t1_170424_F3]
MDEYRIARAIEEEKAFMEDGIESEQEARNLPDQPRPIEVITEEIQFYKRQAGSAILEIGRRLTEAKEQLPHGEWLPWLEREVEFSETTAQRFMRLSREYSNPSPVTDLGASKALVLLALPVSERDEFISRKHIIDGKVKTVEEMSKRELEKAIRERDEAKKEAEKARREAEEARRRIDKQLEEQRKVYDVDMEQAREKLREAENRADGYHLKLEEQKAKAEQLVQDADREMQDLKAQLEELQNAVPEVAVETVVDQEAVRAAAEAARKEAEEKLKAKIDRAEKAKAKAEQAMTKAEQDLATMKTAQEEEFAAAEREKQAMTEQVQALRKKLAVASSSEIAVFKLHFESAQTAVNRMMAGLDKLWDSGDDDGAGKMAAALLALLRATEAAVKSKQAARGGRPMKGQMDFDGNVYEEDTSCRKV